MGVAVCAIVTMLGVADVFEQAVTQLFTSRDVQIIVTRAGAAQRIAATLDGDIGGRIESLTGVQSVEGMLVDVISFIEANLLAVYVLGWPADSVMMGNLRLIEGMKLQSDVHGQVLLGATLARNLDKKIGETIELEGEEFTVVGIHDSANIFEKSMAVVVLSDLQRIMEQPNRVNAFMVKATVDRSSESNLRELATAITNLAGPDGAKLGLSAELTQEHVQSTLELKVVRGMSWSTSVIALVIGVIGMLNTMMISVFERTREIGILRGIGWRKSWVIRMILSETIVLSVVGALVGIVMSIGLTWVLATFPAASQLIIPTHASVKLMLQATSLALVAGAIGAIYPARVASKLQPTDALRHD
jgi:putative ABC transport system permease protein